MDTTSDGATPAAPPVGESKAQEQARLRRERRNAKIQAGGSERLSKITSLSGRPVAAEAELSRSRPSPSPSPQPKNQPQRARVEAADPDEVDIDSAFQQEPLGNPDMTAQQQALLLRQMLGGAPDGASAAEPGQPQHAGMNAGDDPMLQMMQQMLAGMNGQGQSGQPGAAAGADMMGGLAEMFGGAQPPPEPQSRRADYLWRILHALCSVGLTLYLATNFNFTGSELSRNRPLADIITPPKMFWMFTTVELVLQSTRYFMDKGKLPASGILGGLGRMLPNPYGNYIRLFSRYSIIYMTILRDAMVMIFVLGCLAWWNGAV